MSSLLRPLAFASLAIGLGACDRAASTKSQNQAAKKAPAKAEPNAGEQAGQKDAKAQGQAADPKDAAASKAKDAAKASASAEKSSIKFSAPYDQTPEMTATYKNGLIYEDFVIGKGIPAEKGSRLAIHYTGYLLDGTVFDSSVENKRPPFLFELGQGRVIKGWDQGIEGMRAGGKRKLIIPSELAYGSSSRGKIPANAKLVFTLEMIQVRPPLPAPQGEEAFKGRPVAKKRTPSGMRITDYKVGTGEVAAKGDTIMVHYTGSLKDGTVFDTSINRGRPFSFSLGAGRVIKGWDEGIEGMKVGGLRRLQIPPALGYGDRDMGKIPPKSRLEFTVELMDVVKPAKLPEDKDTANKDADKDKKDAPKDGDKAKAEAAKSDTTKGR